MSRSNGESSSTDEPTERLNRLERKMLRSNSLEMAAIRRLLHGLSDTSTGTGPVAEVDAIITRIETLETDVQRLQAHCVPSAPR